MRPRRLPRHGAAGAGGDGRDGGGDAPGGGVGGDAAPDAGGDRGRRDGDAELDDGEGEYGVTDPHLRIEHAGAVALDAGIGDFCDHCFFDGTRQQPNVELHDLDGDGEPEVLVDSFTGGAHCCTDLGLWDYRPELGTYGHAIRHFGNSGYSLEDLDGDGKPEFVSSDDRFAYTFAAYVFSVRPPQVLTWSRTPRLGFTDVTRRFPKLIQQDAAELRRTLRGKAPEDVDLRGPLAAYVADMYLLGRGGEGRTEIARLRKRGRIGSSRDGFWPGGKRFEPALLAFLKKTGYR